VRQLIFISLLGSSLLVASVRADGEQIMPGGAQAVGRGGATAARPTDASTMLQNPAGLVDLPGNQAYYDLDTTFNSVCVQPYGYYGWGVYLPEDRPGTMPNPDAHRSEFGDPTSTAYGSRHLDTVCNSGLIAPTPQIAFALHITDRLAVAFGFVAPVFVSGTQFGGSDGTIEVEKGQARPTPTRYDLIRQEVKFALNPTVSAAYAVMPWLALGMTLQVTMAGGVNNYSVIALRAGTSPSSDMLARLNVSDYFIPSLTFAAYAKPTSRIRLAGTFTWSDGFDGYGDLTFTTGYYHRGAVGDELLPLENDPVKLKRVRVEIPWTATLAARYAQPRLGAPASTDVMTSEIWDVEADASYTANQSAGPNRVEIQNDFALEFRRANGAPQMPLTVKQEDLKELNVERHLIDFVALRLGASYNLLPGRLQLSAGGFFQTRSTDASYASIANYGLRRGGLGLGVVVRLGSVDLMAAYAHVFQEELDLAPPPHQPRTEATDDPKSGFDQRIYENGQLSDKPLTDPNAPAPSAANGVASGQQPAVLATGDIQSRVVNAGRYTASFNVLSIGLVHHF
jgi:hypothetical protein